MVADRIIHTKMTIYEVTYSTKSTSSDKSSFADVILVEAEAYEELYTKVVNTLLRTLVDRIKRFEPSASRRTP
jgi:hypothetical protein